MDCCEDSMPTGEPTGSAPAEETPPPTGAGAQAQLANAAPVVGKVPVAELADEASRDTQGEPVDPAAPVKVLVIDDELAGLTAGHLRELAAPFLEQLGDLTSPTAEAVWAIVAARTGRAAFDEIDPDDVSTYFASDDFVREVVLHDDLRNAQLPVQGLLTRFYAQEAIVRELRTLLQSAYAAPAFQLTFQSARPAAPAALMAYDLVVLDLVLAKSAGAVDELVKYLETLAASDAKLPCLIVLSSREEMLENRPRFSTEGNISAAGLLLLEKKRVRNAQFGVTGLLLCYEQLARQRDVAQNLRMFIRAWMNGLEEGKKSAAETLWNLDAAAMQEIHFSANSDDDPYDAHLTELVSREHLWHVEGVAPVIKAVEALDQAFQKHLKVENGKPQIGERFVAPYADPKPGRSLVSHYNWTGFTPTGRLDAHSEDDLARKLNRLVPFGAVLAPETLADGAECWIHITQQCDLNGAVRPPKPGEPPEGIVSAMFAIATAMVVNDKHVPIHHTSEQVARGLRVGKEEFDLKLINGRLISLPVKQIIKLARDEKRQVVGRLRHDIAAQFLNATANHMTRAAQLKATRMEVRPSLLFLWGKEYNDDKPLAFSVGEDKITTVQVSTGNKQYYLADDAGMWVALWLTEIVRTHLGKTDVAPTKVYNTLRGGMKKGGNVISVINLDVVTRAFDKLDEIWAGKLPEKPVLYIVQEPDSVV